MPIHDAHPWPDAPATLTKATLRAAAGLGLHDAALAKVIGVSALTVSRYKKGAALIDPSRKEGELAILLVRVFRSLDPLVGSGERKRFTWMRSHNTALKGVPERMILRPDGLTRTLAYLEEREPSGTEQA